MSDLFARGVLTSCLLRQTFHLSPTAGLMGVKEQTECDKERTWCEAGVDVPTLVGQQLEISSHLGHFWKP